MSATVQQKFVLFLVSSDLVQRQKTIQNDFLQFATFQYSLQIQSRNVNGHLHADERLRKTPQRESEEVCCLWVMD